MLLNKQERRHKRFIALEKEANQLYRIGRKLPWVEVKPYQDGWLLRIELREDIKRRGDALHIQEALNLVARHGGTKKPKTVAMVRKVRRLDDVYRIMASTDRYIKFLETNDSIRTMRESYASTNWNYFSDSPPSLGRIHPDVYDKLSEGTKKWFYKVVDETKHWGNRESYATSIPRFYMVVRTRPAMVTHIRDIDSGLMKRKNEVDRELESLRYQGAGWHYYSYRHFEKMFGDKSLRAITRAAISKFMKGEAEDFEIKKKIRNYD